MINGYTQSSYGPLNNLNADNGIWRIYTTNVQDRDNIFLRGGRGNYGANSGLFTLYLSWRATTRDSDVGFRCGF